MPVRRDRVTTLFNRGPVSPPSGGRVGPIIKTEKTEMTFVRAFAPAALAAVLALASPLAAAAVTLHGGPDAAMAQTVAAKAGDTVTVSVKTANLRSGPSTKSKKIAGMAQGTKLQVVEVIKSGWLKVKGPAGDGYVAGKLVK